MSATTPLERMRAWAEDEGLTRVQLAEVLGCSQAQATRLYLGQRKMRDINVCARLERATRRWRGGVIRATEWAYLGTRVSS